MNKEFGFHLPAFIGGPIWYISVGLYLKAIVLLIILVGSMFLSLPFILIYCGFKGRRDLYEAEYTKKARVDIELL